ncbi:hypothetical protein PHYBLDRAFT_175154 [Phycomyces blakesleeanus NRRL 1555(-)]|uniref:Uncharacterized protein n=1 Tax=Phycomyces blakesleeanus (strain ATCC 8743b / DSM 1359 / FGSC 10004 / NBRC 33097 / NRRL 1555) TaxID=763407 RepID=A0A167JSD3_PHYB8|nr:hypothetical protein PHYBLDRAFT_175154 [Phycomyces blakesleeanus NRRL 1555(-)]OAD66609.1 hypothetical protein PHYBLDRAFT_175154 [Phycomyces blakesleeanus NRRL 1555(-)]|eukprot:XP_018284649.1 hypothetical protein PHYBLDRAFT_175154 [Phycomyces blakesleeanus NRRL 1555(-)]
MSTLLPSSIMQGMSPNLASFLGNMQAQFMSLQQHINELESLAATIARLTAQLVNAEKLIADLRSQLASQGNCQITTNASTSSAPTTPNTGKITINTHREIQAYYCEYSAFYSGVLPISTGTKADLVNNQGLRRMCIVELSLGE